MLTFAMLIKIIVLIVLVVNRVENSQDKIDDLTTVKENIKSKAGDQIISEGILLIINGILSGVTENTYFRLTDGYYKIEDWNQGVDLQVCLTNFGAESITGAEIKEIEYSTDAGGIKSELYVKFVRLTANYALNNWLWDVNYENVPGQVKIDLTDLKISWIHYVKFNTDTEQIHVTWFKIDYYKVENVSSSWSSFEGDSSFNNFFNEYVKNKPNSITWTIEEVVNESQSGPAIWFERVSEFISQRGTVSASI